MTAPLVRIAVAALTLSAAAFVGLAVKEGYEDKAYIPTKNDVPTIGFGSTTYENGKRVQMGDKITPVRSLVVALDHVGKVEKQFQQSLEGASLHQREYDIYVDWVYQYGMGAWNGSSMRRKVLAKDYRGACDAMLLYKFSGGYDCSVPGNRICAGVWTRQLERHKACIAAQ